MPGNYSKLVTVVTGQTITASERNNEHDNHISNATPDGLDDASESLGAMQATADPYPGASASQPTTLRGEIQQLRYLLAQLSGKSQWYIDPDTSIAAVNTVLTDAIAALSDGATPAATAASLKIRLDHIVTQLKALSGGANWYTAIGAAALLKSGGTMAGAIAMGSNKITGLAAATANGDALRYEQLKVIQIVTATSTTPFTTTASTFQTTNLSASITPRDTSSKILVIASGNLVIGALGQYGFATLARGGSNLLASQGQGLVRGSAGAVYAPCTLTCLDAPASASALTYAVQIRNGDAATSTIFGDGVTTQHILLAEVVA